LIPKQKVTNKVLDEKKDNTKEILGDKAIKPTRDAYLPYDTFMMTNGKKKD
jgi:hypothetical protein